MPLLLLGIMKNPGKLSAFVTAVAAAQFISYDDGGGGGGGGSIRSTAARFSFSVVTRV